MPKRAHSIESTRVRFSTAARAADECAIPGRPWCGDSVTFTILPPLASGIIARVATAWVISQVPSTFSRITVRNPFGVMSSAGVMYCPPALFTSRSIRLWRSSTDETSTSTCSSSRMSQTSASTPPPSAAAAVSSSGSALRPHTTTRAPSAASSSAVALPSPDPPPVTTATCPSSRPGWKILEGIAAAAYPPRARYLKNCPWKPNGMWCGASARAISSNEPASSTSRNERPERASSTTDSTTPASSASVPGSRTNTGSPG